MKRLFKKVKNWEQWPFKILYAPITPVWVWYMIRSGSVWFFTPSNPKLTFGGMEGEPKKEMYDLLPIEYCPESFNVKPQDDFKKIENLLKEHQINFPLIVKPEIGGQGILIRKIDDIEKLKYYHHHSPVEYIVQQLITYPLEVSVFYYRFPHEEKGKITGFLCKTPLNVIGNGKQTLKELIAQHPKGAKRMNELQKKLGDSINKIIPDGEIFPLSHAANHNRGAQFVSLENKIDEKLTGVIDKISHSVNDFFYGRYDIMCNSVEELKQGKNFKILEYNGCGAEPNHFYDTGYTLAQAYKEILHHWKVLYKISRYNKKRGVEYWPFFKGIKFLRDSGKHYKIIRKADKNLQEFI